MFVSADVTTSLEQYPELSKHLEKDNGFSTDLAKDNEFV